MYEEITSELSMFADDLQFYVSDEDSEEVIDTLEKDGTITVKLIQKELSGPRHAKRARTTYFVHF